VPNCLIIRGSLSAMVWFTIPCWTPCGKPRAC